MRTVNAAQEKKYLRGDNECKHFSFENLLITAQKMKFSIKDFFSKCDQICRKLRTWSHLLKKPLMENFIFCAMYIRMKVVNRVK